MYSKDRLHFFLTGALFGILCGLGVTYVERVFIRSSDHQELLKTCQTAARIGETCCNSVQASNTLAKDVMTTTLGNRAASLGPQQRNYSPAAPPTTKVAERIFQDTQASTQTP